MQLRLALSAWRLISRDRQWARQRVRTLGSHVQQMFSRIGRRRLSALDEQPALDRQLLEAPEAGDVGSLEAFRPTHRSTDLSGAEGGLSSPTCGKRLCEVVSSASLLALPITLRYLFLVLPIVTHAIFSAFDCEAFEYDDEPFTMGTSSLFPSRC